MSPTFTSKGRCYVRKEWIADGKTEAKVRCLMKERVNWGKKKLSYMFYDEGKNKGEEVKCQVSVK